MQLQVILIVPEDVSTRREVIQTLARSAVQRGRDVGFSLVRFDAGSDAVLVTSIFIVSNLVSLKSSVSLSNRLITYDTQQNPSARRNETAQGVAGRVRHFRGRDQGAPRL